MKRKIYVCPKCGRGLNFSDNSEYTFQCFECDEDFYSFEAKEIEQPRMEGVVDYTDLTEAAMKIKEISETTIETSNREIAIKSTDIINQIAEYINETLAPIFDSGIHKESTFIDCARIYNGSLRLKFGSYHINNHIYNAEFSCGTTIFIYFNTNHEYVIETHHNNNHISYLARNWRYIKEEMNRMIPYAIKECGQKHQRKLEKQKEIAEVIEGFRL